MHPQLPQRGYPAAGSTVGPYLLIEKIGAGGMGLVYKARDTRLDRLVAIKFIRPEGLQDPLRRQRLLVEAKSASALNHPNIVTIHDVSRADDAFDFVVMELVGGRTLNDLIGRKGLPLADALDYGIQIADGVARAHAAGILHRDLKPANIIVTADRVVKILDFGLARLFEADTDATQTLDRNSVEGTVAGTPAYMSPEQVQGKSLDQRSDIFSFGAVLYEMLSGRRAFPGTSHAATLSAVLDQHQRPIAEIPPLVERVVNRCLRKDPRKRFQTMADLKVALEELKEESESGSLGALPNLPERRSLPRLVIIACAIAAAAAAVAWRLQHSSAPAVQDIAITPLTSLPGEEFNPTFSPDGSQFAFAWDGGDGNNTDIYVSLATAGRPVRLTSDPAEDYSPAWSPDGQRIAFVRQSEGRMAVILVPALGGRERKLLEGAARRRSLQQPSLVISPTKVSWSTDGRWLAVEWASSAAAPSAISLVNPDTGGLNRITSPPPTYSGDASPSFSPDGRTLAFARKASPSVADIYVVQIENGHAKGEPRRVTHANQFVASPAWATDGRLLYVHGPSGAGERSVWSVLPEGNAPPVKLGALGDNVQEIAAGKRTAITKAEMELDIWQITLDKPTAPASPLIVSSRGDSHAKFAPDGKRIAVVSSRSGSQEIWLADADGENPTRLTHFNGPLVGMLNWSPDGETIVFHARPGGQAELFSIQISGGAPRQLTDNEFDDVYPTFSRDGRWIYFCSRREGTQNVWRMPSAGGAAVRVTSDGGTLAVESPDALALYYSTVAPNRLWRMDLRTHEKRLIADHLLTETHFALARGGIYYLTEPSSYPEVHFLPFESQMSRRIASIPGRVYLALSLTPAADRLIYTQLIRTGSDILAVSQLP